MSKSRIHTSLQIAGALGMILLLALAALAPMAGGWVQWVHRANRQSALRRGKSEFPAVRIVVPAKALSEAYLFPEKELIWNGLRYDVLSLHTEGELVVFQAVPDIKETRLCAWMAGKTTSMESVQRLVWLEYLPHPPELFPKSPLLAQTRSAFGPGKAGCLAGFESIFSPPPDPVFRWS
jgi:hypothetical protein